MQDIPAIVYGVGDYGMSVLPHIKAQALYRVTTMAVPVSEQALDGLKRYWDAPIGSETTEGDDRYEAFFDIAYEARVNVFILDPYDRAAVAMVEFLADCLFASGKLGIGLLKSANQGQPPIDGLRAVLGGMLEFEHAPLTSNQHLVSVVRGIAEFYTRTGIINQKPCDMGRVLGEGVLFAAGTSVGNCESIEEVARAAMESPLLKQAITSGVTGMLINITSATGGVYEYDRVGKVVLARFPELDNAVGNHLFDEGMQKDVRVTVMMAYQANRNRPSY